MAAALPAKLKAAGVQRFATRAAQLEKFRPIITYWCEYYILQFILQKQLHTSDEECTTYAVHLMDKLERYKAENSKNDAIVDDVAAKVYVENLAVETLNKGYATQTANKVTLQTADTFSAAATFLELLSIWGPLDPEIAEKIKFAKFHAARIAKAIKAGEDPNASNPVVEPVATPAAAVTDDSLEAELQEMERSGSTVQSRQPTVEAVPEDGQEDTSFAPSNQDNAPDVSQAANHGEPQGDETESTNSRANSIGGGYFPNVPSTVASSGPSEPAAMDRTPSGQAPDLFYSNQTLQSPTVHLPSAPQQFNIHSPVSSALPPKQATVNTLPTPRGPVPAPSPQSGAAGPTKYREDDDSIAAAQKHAKWAISALQFEDVNTAVKELRIALQSLGAN